MSKQIATNRPKRGIPTEKRAARQKTQRDGSRPRRVRSLVAPTRVRVVGALIVGLVLDSVCRRVCEPSSRSHGRRLTDGNMLALPSHRLTSLGQRLTIIMSQRD